MFLEAFDEVVGRYGIQGKVKKVVCDNASSMKKAFDHSLPTMMAILLAEANDSDEEANVDNEEDDGILDVADDQEELFSLCPQRVSCFAHTLQLVVKDGLAAIKPDSILSKAINSVSKKMWCNFDYC